MRPCAERDRDFQQDGTAHQLYFTPALASARASSHGATFAIAPASTSPRDHRFRQSPHALRQLFPVRQQCAGEARFDVCAAFAEGGDTGFRQAVGRRCRLRAARGEGASFRRLEIEVLAVVGRAVLEGALEQAFVGLDDIGFEEARVEQGHEVCGCDLAFGRPDRQEDERGLVERRGCVSGGLEIGEGRGDIETVEMTAGAAGRKTGVARLVDQPDLADARLDVVGAADGMPGGRTARPSAYGPTDTSQ